MRTHRGRHREDGTAIYCGMGSLSESYTNCLIILLCVRCRLWAEVFHVSMASGSTATVKWQQVSEDLVPVNISCVQDSPECIFHISAYNSQVDKILDVRLMQPGKLLLSISDNQPRQIQCFRYSYTGTRIGQASECFVYWKDPMTNDTWGLNFTSPIDAKQFRECCVSSLRPAAATASITNCVYHNPFPTNSEPSYSATVMTFRVLCVFCPEFLLRRLRHA